MPSLAPSPWIERRFNFDVPESMYPNVVERVRGGPARAAAVLENVPLALLTRRLGNAWSMQENIGHLSDLESLWATRLDQLVEGKAVLEAWEETNRATWEADHNSRPLAEILSAFASARRRLVERLDSLDVSLVGRTALHPRLKQPMRTIDLVFFVAEHDDYHLAKVTALKREFSVLGGA